MKELPDLENLSPQEKDTLIIGLWEELLKLRKQVDELQAKQQQPKKTSKNSGFLPAKEFKPNVEISGLEQALWPLDWDAESYRQSLTKLQICLPRFVQ